MRSVNELVPIATGTVPAHVVNQDEEYIWPDGSLCLPLGPNPGGMNSDQADNKKQGKEWLHLATFVGTRGIRLYLWKNHPKISSILPVLS